MTLQSHDIATLRAQRSTTKPLQSHYTATTDPHTATLREQRSTSRPLFPLSPKIKRRMHRQIQKFPTRGIRKCAASCKSSQRDGSENAPRVAKVPNERPPKTAREFQRRASRWQGECPRPPSTTSGGGGPQRIFMCIDGLSGPIFSHYHCTPKVRRCWLAFLTLYPPPSFERALVALLGFLS